MHLGIDIQSARFLLASRKLGVTFRRTAMLGRQEFHVTPEQVGLLASEFALNLSEIERNQLEGCSFKYAEPFFRYLGAEEIASFDASTYENATHIHDMNQPIAGDLKERFDVVFDGGSLEHIFNFPVAIGNCIELVRTGGHFISICPTNNYPAHGFYQFGAELFYRICSEENGLKMLEAAVTEPSGPFYRIPDAASMRRRLYYTTSGPVQLMILANRVAAVQLFARTPQQSDYTLMWDDIELLEDREPEESRYKTRIKSILRIVADRSPGARKVMDRIRRHRRERAQFRKWLAGLGACSDLIPFVPSDHDRFGRLERVVRAESERQTAG